MKGRGSGSYSQWQPKGCPGTWAITPYSSFRSPSPCPLSLTASFKTLFLVISFFSGSILEAYKRGRQGEGEGEREKLGLKSATPVHCWGWLGWGLSTFFKRKKIVSPMIYLYRIPIDSVDHTGLIRNWRFQRLNIRAREEVYIGIQMKGKAQWSSVFAAAIQTLGSPVKLGYKTLQDAHCYSHPGLPYHQGRRLVTPTITGQLKFPCSAPVRFFLGYFRLRSAYK